MLFWAWTVFFAFFVAFSRFLEGPEASSANRALIQFAVYAGIALVAIDGIPNRRRLDQLIGRIVDLGAFVALMGIVQFITGFDPATQLTVPGLQLNNELFGREERSIFDRVASTAGHPIEFSAVLAVLLVLALHRAVNDDGSRRGWAWARVAVLAAAMPMSVSRTGVLVAFVGLLVLARAWGWRRRFNLLVAGSIFLVFMRSAVPGLLGTIRSLFTNVGNDPSVEGRTDDFVLIFEFVGERPYFGRGLGTFIPEVYFFVDNQWLLTLVDGGILGLVGLIVLMLGSATVARQVFWRRWGTEAGELGNAFAAMLVAASVGFATFDALGFRMNAGLVFLTIGMVGALWRIEVRDPGVPWRTREERLAAAAEGATRAGAARGLAETR